jgi:hypothetical protein
MRYAVQLHERCLRVVDTEAGVIRAPKNPPRGVVKGISNKSRGRLIKLLAKVNRPDAPVFITLTYREYTDNFEEWKADLNRFVCSFRYHFPTLAGIWRLEFQERGAPHYHLLLWLGERSTVGGVEDTARNCWLNAIGQHSRANQEHGITVEHVADFRECAFYISLYAAKDAQDRKDIQTGREWGCWGKERLNLLPIETLNLCANGLRLFRRITRRAYVARQRSNGKRCGNFLHALRRPQPFTAFCSYAEARRVVCWVAANVEAILADNVGRCLNA